MKLFNFLLLMSLLLLSFVSRAQTPFNEEITNQAQVNYVDTAHNVAELYTSNVASIRVASNYAVELRQDSALYILANQEAIFAHVLTNTGNLTETIDVFLPNLAGDDFDIDGLSLFHDLNGDGQLSAGEPKITNAITLDAGSSINLVTWGRAPSNVIKGDAAQITIQANVQNSTASAINTDTINIIDGAFLQLTSEADPLCVNTVIPSTQLTYQLSLSNIGNAEPVTRSVLINNVQYDGVLLENAVPANSTLVKSTDWAFSPTTAKPLVMLIATLESGCSSCSWTTYNDWNGIDPVAFSGLFIDASNLDGGDSASLNFTIQVNANLTTGTNIINNASIDLNNNGQVDLISNDSTCFVDSGTYETAIISFMQPSSAWIADCTADSNLCSPLPYNSAEFAPAGTYLLDSGINGLNYELGREGVYIEVHSTSLNSTSYLSDTEYSAQTIIVKLASEKTGDTIYVQIQETAPNSGIFRSLYPIRLSPSETGDGRTCSLTNTIDCVLKSDSRDSLSASILDPGTNRLIIDAAVVDPLGIVFDSSSLNPIAGAVVSLRRASDDQLALDPDSGGATTLAPQTTGADGRYHYPRIFPDVEYYIRVDPVLGYTNPSILPTTAFGATPFTVNSHSYGRDGFTGVFRSGTFSLPVGSPALIIDVPLDPAVVNGGLLMEKTASARQAEVGEFITYELTIKNNSGFILNNMTVNDYMPFGFKYVVASSKVDGVTLIDPLNNNDRSLLFNIGQINIDVTIKLTYILQVTPGAVDGTGINTAVANAETATGTKFESNRVSHKIKLVQDALFSDKGFVFGKIFVDTNCDDIQTEGEWPVPGVRLYMENGTWVITDENGQYSLYGLNPGHHIIKIDNTTLPEGAQLIPTDNRHAGDPSSRFVDLIAGEMHRADFVLHCSNGRQKKLLQALKARQKSVATKSPFDSMFNSIKKAAERSSLSHTTSTAQVSSTDGDKSNSIQSADSIDPILSSDVSASTQQPPLTKNNAINVLELSSRITAAQAKAGHWVWPKEDQNISRNGRFIVVVRSGVTPSLYINGKVVSNKQLGEQVNNKREKAQILGWYGIALNPGDNLIEVKAKDMFGNERLLSTRKVKHPGNAHHLMILHEKSKLSADGGGSQLPIRIELQDEFGTPINGIQFVNLETTDGTWREKDLADKIKGHQVRLENGVAQVHLKSSNKTGKVNIRVTNDTKLEAYSEIEFIPAMRPLIAAGIVNLTLHKNTLKHGGDGPDAQKDSLGISNRLQKDAAFFLKGRVKGDLLLTMSYDINKSIETELFRDIDVGSFYPIWGDASSKGFEAQSRSKLYFRLEDEMKQFMWGDFQSDHKAKSGLNTVNRSLTGINAHWENGTIGLMAYGAKTNDPNITEELRANGTATHYQLGNAPIVTNSEKITLIVRDRENTGLVISEKVLQRFHDYQLNALNGYLSFSEPLSSTDKNDNPRFIQISYSKQGVGKKYLVSGVRGTLKVNENISVSAVIHQDKNPNQDYEIRGVDTTYESDDGLTRLRAEVATSDRKSKQTKGNAWRIEGKTKVGENTQLTGHLSKTESGFDNPSAPVSKGRKEARMTLSTTLADDYKVQVSAMQSSNLDTDEKRSSLDANIGTQIGGTKLTVGLRHTNQENAGDNNVLTTVRAKAERRWTILDRDFGASIEHEREFSDSQRSRTKIGMDYALNQTDKLVFKIEKIDSASGVTSLSQSASQVQATLGIQSKWFDSTDVFSEYRLRGGVDGRELESSTGIRGTYAIEEGLDISPVIETVHAWTGQEGVDAVAISVGLVDTRHKNSKKALRLETRISTNEDYYGLQTSWVGRLDLDWSLAVRDQFSLVEPAIGNTQLKNILTLGIAHRPRLTNRHHWLGYYKWRFEKDGVDDELNVHTFATHHNYKVNDDLIISGRVGLKYLTQQINASKFTTDLQLADVRLTWDLTPRWDLDLHAGALSLDWGKSVRHSAGVGVNYLLRKNVRIGVGYNFAGFVDQDLDAQEYNAKGIYLGLQWKFGEEVFDWLAPE